MSNDWSDRQWETARNFHVVEDVFRKKDHIDCALELALSKLYECIRKKRSSILQVCGLDEMICWNETEQGLLMILRKFVLGYWCSDWKSPSASFNIHKEKIRTSTTHSSQFQSLNKNVHFNNRRSSFSCWIHQEEDRNTLHGIGNYSAMKMSEG